MTTPLPERGGALSRRGPDEEDPYATIRRLERLLAAERRMSVKATRQLHRAMMRDVTEARQKAKKASQRAAAAEARAAEAVKNLATARKRTAGLRSRARQAEAELERIKQSSTWKAGRAVVLVPSRIKKRWGSA